MGGQQFLDGGVLLDASGLNRILELDAERGLVRVEAGTLWSDLVRGLRDMQQGQARRWSVVQKQTGADRLSIGGALAANGHGRGLTYKPIVARCGVVRACGRKRCRPSLQPHREPRSFQPRHRRLRSVRHHIRGNAASHARSQGAPCRGDHHHRSAADRSSRSASRTASPTATSSTGPTRLRPAFCATA